MIRCAAQTRAGVLHPENQDRIATDADRGIFVVVDGMGGLADAAATAEVVVSHLPDEINASVDGFHGPEVVDAVTKVLTKLNSHVRETARTGPGTTGAAIAMVLVRDGLALTVHLGDSRIYLARNGKVSLLTEDHTDDGHLTRFMGMPGDVVAGIAVHELGAGDRILLCTDGLTGTVDDRALGSMLSKGELDRVCRRLVEAAAAGGAVDDISVVAVEVLRGHG
jgi:serine/threonine protein phosphatase PrpC